MAGANSAADAAVSEVLSFGAGCKASPVHNFQNHSQMMSTLGTKDIQGLYYLDKPEQKFPNLMNLFNQKLFLTLKDGSA